MLTCLQAIPNLPLPAVVNDTVAVHHADMRCYASSTAAAAVAGKPASSGSSDAAGSPTAVWSQLEQLLAGGDMPSTNWLEGAKQVWNSLALGPVVCLHACLCSPHSLSSLFSATQPNMHAAFMAPATGVPHKTACPTKAGCSIPSITELAGFC